MKWWDQSWNPFYGCTKCGPGCDNCVIFGTLQKQGKSVAPTFTGNISHTRLNNGQNYAVGSLGDVFHEDNEFEAIDQVLAHMNCFANRYFITTRRPHILNQYLREADLPQEVREVNWDAFWFGVSVENQNYMGRVDELLKVPLIRHRYICLEPLLGPVKLLPYLKTGKIDWVIVGAEGGTNPRPVDNDWIRQIVKDCAKTGVSVFVSRVMSGEQATDTISLFPPELKIRNYPWGNEENPFRLYDIVATVRNNYDGTIALRVSKNEFDLLIHAPRFVYNTLREKLKNFKISEAVLTPKLSFMPPKGTPEAQQALEEFRSRFLEWHAQLQADKRSIAFTSELFPKDVIVEFEMKIPLKLVDWGRDFPTIESDPSKPDAPEVKQFLKTLQVVFQKWKRSHNNEI